MMNANTPEWILRIMQVVRPLVPQDFVGLVEVNCFLGGVTSVNVRQSYKPPQQP